MSKKIISYFGFIRNLPEFFHNRIDFQKASEIIKSRLSCREENFLNLINLGIYENPRHPAYALLKASGIDFSHIKKLTFRYGIEGALEELRGNDIYFSHEEFKGLKPLKRFGKTFHLNPADFDNPYLRSGINTFSGGSKGPGTRTVFNLDYLEQWSAYDAFLFEMCKAWDVPMALWLPELPAYAGIKALVCYSKVGKSLDRWFVMNDKRIMFWQYLPYFFLSRYVASVKRFSGGRTLFTFLPLPETDKILHWITAVLKDVGRCVIHTYTSAAVRICMAAREKGINIAGTIFFVGSDPLTQERKAVIEKNGCFVVPRYIITEIGPLAYGCFQNHGVDNMHILEDSVALIPFSSGSGTLQNESSVRLLATNLLLVASKIMVNVETGDYGVIESSKCDCLWHELGFKKVISNVRSYKKIKSAGVTFDIAEVIDCIEHLFVHKLNRSPEDFQLIEEEKDGLSNLWLYVNPALDLPKDKIISMVFEEISKINDKYGILVDLWRKSSILKVIYNQPTLTKIGKQLSFIKKT